MKLLVRALAGAYDAPSSYITDTLFVWRGLPITVGKDGGAKRDLRGTGAAAPVGESLPCTLIALWKLGRRSRGGMTGGAAEILDL